MFGDNAMSIVTETVMAIYLQTRLAQVELVNEYSKTSILRLLVIAAFGKSSPP